MQYNSTIPITLCGYLTPGSEVVVKLVKADTDTIVPATTYECIESVHVPGLFRYSLGNLQDAQEYLELVFVMEDSVGEQYGGKIVMNDAILTTDDKERVLSLETAVVEINDETLHSGLDSYSNKDDWKDTSSADITTLLTEVTSMKVDTASLVTSNSNIQHTVSLTKELIEGIDDSVNMLDTNGVNSIYGKLLEVSIDIQTLLTATSDVPANTYDVTFGKRV